ncbi:MAG: hypothetical protein WCG00_18255, partial [Hyphomicrobiales bacterium]
DKLPEDVLNMGLPITSANECGGIVIVPNVKIVRVDFDQPKDSELIEHATKKQEDFRDKIIGLMPLTPERLRNRIKAQLDSIHVIQDWTKPGDKITTIADLTNATSFKDADYRFVLLGKSNSVNDEEVKTAFGNFPETYFVKEKASLGQLIASKLCSQNQDQDRQNIEGKTIAVVSYKSPTTPPPPCDNNGKSGCNSSLPKCNQEALIQGIQFLSLAQATKDKALQQANLNNAFQRFNLAVEESQSSGGCCGKALMNRGIVRDYLKQPQLARQDLEAAANGQCGQPDKEILYNLACHYSKHSSKENFTLDVALQTLEKALDTGFKDCDILLTDKDLANLRKDSDYKKRFIRILNQHGLYCQGQGFSQSPN